MFQQVFKYNPNHYPAGAEEGKGGQFAPSDDEVEFREIWKLVDRYYQVDEKFTQLMRDKSKELYPTLTPPEKHALSEYTHSAYRPMNRVLAGKDVGNYITPKNTVAPLEEKIRGMISDLDSVLSKSTIPDNIMVHRGVAGENFVKAFGINLDKWVSVSDTKTQETLKSLTGKVYTEPAFSSTSLRDEYASYANVSDKIGTYRLDIEVPKGSHGLYAAPFSFTPGEEEVILPRGSRFFIKSVTFDKSRNGNTLVPRIKLRLLGPEDKKVVKFNPNHEPAGSPTGGQFAESPTNSPEFKEWFGSSKVVDSKGKPLEAYHLTAVGTDFEEFIPGGKFGKGAGRFRDVEYKRQYGHDPYESGPVIWFSPDRETQNAAHHVREENAPGARVIPVYLKMENPLVIPDLDSKEYKKLKSTLEKWGLPTSSFVVLPSHVQSLRDNGYDGIIQLDEKGKVYEYAVLDSTQVKSVFNQGTWSSKDKRISKLDHIFKYNPNHVPAGSPEGGQFAPSEFTVNVTTPHNTVYISVKTKGKYGDKNYIQFGFEAKKDKPLATLTSNYLFHQEEFSEETKKKVESMILAAMEEGKKQGITHFRFNTEETDYIFSADHPNYDSYKWLRDFFKDDPRLMGSWGRASLYSEAEANKEVLLEDFKGSRKNFVIAHHGTRTDDWSIDPILSSAGVVHLGTQRAAEERIGLRYSPTGFATFGVDLSGKPSVHKVIINAKAIQDINSPRKESYTEYLDKKKQKELSEKGIHGVAYLNQVEDKGSLSIMLWDKRGLKEVKKHESIFKYNQNHVPAGSPEGGQFAPADFPVVVTSSGTPTLKYKKLLSDWSSKQKELTTESEKLAVDNYTDVGYKYINRFLGGWPGYAEESMAGSKHDPIVMTIGEAVSQLDSVISKSELPTNMKLFRGVAGLNLLKQLGVNFKSPIDVQDTATMEKYKSLVGKVYSEPTFISTTLMEGVYMSFTAAQESMGRFGIEIDAKKGHKGHYVTSGEQEVILPRGSRFQITDVSFEASGTSTVVPKFKVTLLDQEKVTKYNPNHAPAGTPQGGQFTSADGVPPEQDNRVYVEPIYNSKAMEALTLQGNLVYLGLTAPEKEAFRSYFSNGYTDINRAVSGRVTVFPHTRMKIENMDRVFSRPEAKLPENVILYRDMAATHLFKHFEAEGVDTIGANPAAVEALKKLVGKVYTEKGFVSTSMSNNTTSYSNAASLLGSVHLVIKAKKGSSGFIAGDLSFHHDENEVLLNRNSKFLITGVGVHKAQYRNVPLLEVTLL